MAPARKRSATLKHVFEIGDKTISATRNPKKNKSHMHLWDNDTGDRRGYIHMPGQVWKTIREKITSVRSSSLKSACLISGRIPTWFEMTTDEDGETVFLLTVGGERSGYDEPLSEISFTPSEIDLLLRDFHLTLKAIEEVEKHCQDVEYGLYHSPKSSAARRFRKQNRLPQGSSSEDKGANGSSGTDKTPEQKQQRSSKQKSRKEKDVTPTPANMVRQDAIYGQQSSTSGGLIPEFFHNGVGAECTVYTTQ